MHDYYYFGYKYFLLSFRHALRRFNLSIRRLNTPCGLYTGETNKCCYFDIFTVNVSTIFIQLPIIYIIKFVIVFHMLKLGSCFSFPPISAKTFIALILIYFFTYSPTPSRFLKTCRVEGR
jgi:hypothetical protein